MSSSEAVASSSSSGLHAGFPRASDTGPEREPLLSSRHHHYAHWETPEESALEPVELEEGVKDPVHAEVVTGDEQEEDEYDVYHDSNEDAWAEASPELEHGKSRRQLGLTSAAFLIFNRVIGTGIFATPSVILRSSGSVGLSLMMWLLGATVAACGTAVYIELGTGLPHSGGEKNYLDFIYRRPRFLATCTYAAYAVFIGWQSASCSVFGEYALHAIQPSRVPSAFSTRLASLGCITFAFLLHGTHVRWGLRLQNALGLAKLLILIGIALIGLAVLAGMRGFELDDLPRNLQWSTMWKGSASGGANAFVTGLYNVIWSFIGYSNANYALSEVRDPVRTLKRAAPLAMLLVTLVYLLVNIAYYAVVSRTEILGSGRIVAALFFGRVWGEGAERLVSAIVALSTLGNVLAVLFTHGRVIQELGRERILPFSSFFASNRPFNAPLAGMFAQYVITALLVVAVPAGDAYLFMLNMSSYPLSLINTLVSGGLLMLHVPSSVFGLKFSESVKFKYNWHPPFRAYTPAVGFFFLSNIFLAFAPLIPPAAGFSVYEKLPYWLHVFTGFAISSVGIAYWYVRCRWLPARRGYRVIKQRLVQEDGISRNVMKKIYL